MPEATGRQASAQPPKEDFDKANKTTNTEDSRAKSICTVSLVYRQSVVHVHEHSLPYWWYILMYRMCRKRKWEKLLKKRTQQKTTIGSRLSIHAVVSTACRIVYVCYHVKIIITNHIHIGSHS